MGMGFVPTWLRQVSPPLLHKTTLTTETENVDVHLYNKFFHTSLYSARPQQVSNFVKVVQKWLGTNMFVRIK